MMSEFLFEFLLVKSLGVCLLTLIILVSRPVILKHLNARVAYKLWFSIPIFMLLPINFVEENLNVAMMTFFDSPSLLLPAVIPVEHLLSYSLTLQVLTLWCLGFALSLAVNIYRYQHLKKSLNDFDYQLPNQIKQKVGKIKLAHTRLVEVPAVFGFINTYLILPKDFAQYSQQQQLIILSHELYHIARRDYQINILRSLIKCIFWFNPLIYFADKYVEADQEISCDLAVIHSAEQFGLRQYGETLLSAIGMEHKANLVSQWNYKNLIRERLKMLKNTKQHQWHNWVAASLALVSLWTASSVSSKEKITESGIHPVTVVQPGYPIKAAKNNVEGMVTFKFDLTPAGAVVHPKIVVSEPAGVFDKYAMEAFKQWNFGEQKNRAGLTYTMKFQLRQSVVPALTENDVSQIRKELSELEVMIQDTKNDLAKKRRQTNLNDEQKRLITSLESYLVQLYKLKDELESEIS